ncbi:hypothetical protein SARC_07038 [Sphaeroforma arctica JP610]|uniref:DASH complex subunit DAM1 n=1 Tax=Sphaeroforma arctica JP610 TaxID=667725 RepID=A0A0L0FUV5_9EUKA|nr:hypothetical protein SARC_07038 [Sphaeroforma arctica JP610]KNC80602.1 hypothetical protein SARC_07038 [Sphaeroforma arctica JP610]|eukprot:XP_014154504.1 hypothetical protein SARC_07038 [Sphaeroforma arctica JP610]
MELDTETKQNTTRIQHSLGSILQSLRIFENSVHQFSRVNNDLIKINGTFGQFVQGMALTGEITSYPKGPSYQLELMRQQEVQRQKALEAEQIAQRARDMEKAAERERHAQKTGKDTRNRRTGSQIRAPAASPCGAPATKKSRSNTPGHAKTKARTQSVAQRQRATHHTKRVTQIVNCCPSKYQAIPHVDYIKKIAGLLSETPDGLTQPEIIEHTGIPRTNCIEYMSMLLRLGEVTRDNNKKGYRYRLHPKHFDR